MVFDESERLAGEREQAVADATIIIPQHDRAELTLAAVRAVRRHEPSRWPIIVVDDGSSPSAAAAILEIGNDARILRQPHRGVTAAWNLGLRHVSTPLVVLLNNDVLIDGAWVDPLVEPLRQGSTLSGVEQRQERAVPAEILQRIGRREFLAGWCWAFRTAEARAIGGFDPSYCLYFSDTDLQARLLATARPPAEPAVVDHLPLRHVGHCSTRLLAGRRAQWHADRARFIAKWTGAR